MKNPFTKLKWTAKRFATFVALSVIEIAFVLWIANWQPNPALLLPLANIIMFWDRKKD